MRRRILITGRNQMMIDIFFLNMGDTLECQTASARMEDIASHIEYFKPEMYVICLQAETKENLSKLAGIVDMVNGKNIPVALFGELQECHTLMGEMKAVPAFVWGRTSRATQIAGEIGSYLDNRAEQIKEEAPKIEAPKAVKKTPAAAQEAVRHTGGAAQSGAGEVQAVAKKQTANKQKAENQAANKQKAENQTTENPDANYQMEEDSSSSSRKHVTVIDDDYRMLRVLKEYLHGTYDVATAASGKIAMKFLESKHTDLILLDYVMPDEDGPEVYRRIRSMPDYKDTPIVFLTGVREGKKIKEVMELHPQGYLLKPIQEEQLMQTIRSILG
ncbi:MAG: response regulator [Roseburia sp.]|nr:response regulator [Roseburia sp.]